MAFSSNFSSKEHLMDEAIAKAMREIGITGKASCQMNCKVKTGNLRRSHTFKVEGKQVTIGVTKLAPYGIYVEFKPPTRGGRPWFRKTLNAESNSFKRILDKHLGGVR